MIVSADVTPPGETAEVLRLIYASAAAQPNWGFEDLVERRRLWMGRNTDSGIHTALRYGDGWFLQWMEGPSLAVEALMARVAQDGHHQQLQVLHRSLGSRCLPTPFSVVYGARSGASTAVSLATQASLLRRRFDLGQQMAPAQVWRQFGKPLAVSGRTTAPGVSPRVPPISVLLSSAPAACFDLLSLIATTEGSSVVNLRLGGESSALGELAYAYTDVFLGEGEQRLLTTVPKAFRIGVVQAIMPSYSTVALLYRSRSPVADLQLVQHTLQACEQAGAKPQLMGIGLDESTHRQAQARCGSQGLTYLAQQADPFAVDDVWAALRTHLLRSGKP